MNPPLTPGATLYDVVGTPRRSGAYLFVPALLDLDGDDRVLEPLAPAEGTDCPVTLRAVHARLANDMPLYLFLTLRVRSRLPAVFGFAR